MISAHQFMQKQKIIYCPISAGELLDKISILQIKQTKINSPESLECINMELKMLENIKADYYGKNLPIGLETLHTKLVEINLMIWDTEEQRRTFENLGSFDDKFIAISRKSYQLNDHRALIKREINNISNSSIKEFKSY